MKKWYWFKEWKINERIMIRFSINDWMIGFYICRWTWIHILPVSICINFSKNPMYGEDLIFEDE